MEELSQIITWLKGASGVPREHTQGLLTGDPTRVIQRVMFASALTQEVVGEVITSQADLLVTACPPESMTLVGPGGANLRNLVQGDVALYSAGAGAQALVGEACAQVLDLEQVSPLGSVPSEEYAVLVVYVPLVDAEELRVQLAHAGAGNIGDYRGCAWSVTGQGEFTPVAGADPTIGAVGTHEQVEERRLEMVVPTGLIDVVTRALRKHHRYEEPAFSFLRTHPAPSRYGRGAWGHSSGRLTPQEIFQTLKHALPGVQARYSGDGEKVERIGVCPHIDTAVINEACEQRVELLITSNATAADAEGARTRGISVLDVPHHGLMWAALPLLARQIGSASDGEIETIVSVKVQPGWEMVEG